MNSKRDMNLIARVASKRTKSKGKGNTKAARPQGTPPPLPPQAQPSYEELLHFFDESVDLLCIAGFDGFFKRLNPAWTATVGWTIAQLQARPFLDFVLPADRPATLAEWGKLAAGTPTIAFENRYASKDGSYKWLQWSVSPLLGAQEVYAIARDVTRQRLLEREILTAVDQERERLGLDLHDGHCQDLAAIAAFAASLARRLDQSAAPDASGAHEIGKLLRQSIEHVRDLSRGFLPPYLKDVTLPSALADFCANTGSLFKITCTFICDGFHPQADVIRDSNLYRIVQETVSNAVTHGRATRIDIGLAVEGDRGTLTITDDGIGIADQVHGHRGIGLHTMTYRARVIGGSIEIHSRSPGGTAVTCLFPLRASGTEGLTP